MDRILALAEYWFSLVIFSYIAIQAIYFFVFALAGRLSRKKESPASKKKGSFAIYIPAYKEDTVIEETVNAALSLHYPPNLFDIFIIADSLQPSTLSRLKKLPVHIIEVSFPVSTKAKALNTAIASTNREFDFAVVFDADNIASPDFLSILNDHLQNGYSIVQGHRIAKNADTPLALLDALSEEINNHIFRKGHQALGFSSALIGSGMAMRYDLFRKTMAQIHAVGGFDKELELRLIRDGFQIAYAEQAIINDEKVRRQQTFSNQRRRWIAVQLHYLKHYFSDGVWQLIHGKLDYFDKVFQSALLPRLIMIGLLPFLAAVSLLPGHGLNWRYWVAALIIFYAALVMAVPPAFYSRKLLRALKYLPATFISMIRVFFKLKGANQTYLHTPHGELK